MSYPGSKGQAGVFQRIIGQMPPHSIYVEPFYGTGRVFWSKRRADRSILIDRSRNVLQKCKMPLLGNDKEVYSGFEENAGVEFILGDALALLPGLALSLPDDAVIYCDPPYMLETRQGRLYYEFELSNEDHDRLLTILQGLKCRVLLSGYPSALYSAKLSSWRCISYQTRTRGRTVTECLWANFPEPEELHDWRYAGRNFRERLGLKRLVKRWVSRIEGMPARQRGVVLDEIRQRFIDRCLEERQS